MSEKEVFKVPDEVVEEPKAKKRTSRKPISAEHKARLLENLKRGRETKRKNKEANKNDKTSEPVPNHTDTQPAKIIQQEQVHIPKGSTSKDLELQISEMRSMIKELRLERENEKKEYEIKELRRQILELSQAKKELKAEEKKPVAAPVEIPTPSPPKQEVPKPVAKPAPIIKAPSRRGAKNRFNIF